MLRRRRLSLDHLTPMGENESANSVDTLVEIECADQRLDRVGGDIVAVAAAVVARLRAETDERGQVQPLRDRRAGRARRETMQPGGHPALGRFRKTRAEFRRWYEPAPEGAQEIQHR